MTNYAVTTNFANKDTLISGNPLKQISGAQLTTEFNNIATAVATKLDSGSGALTLPASGFFYAQSGAKIQRFNDRVFIGDATVNDGIGPTPTTPDWLTAWQLSIGYPFGSVVSAQTAVLTTQAAFAVTSAIAQLSGTRTLQATANEQSIANAAFAVNNNTSFPTSVWGYYAEAHRGNNVVNAAICMELDVTQRGALVGINPYVQNFGQTVALQLASGAQQGALATASFATNVMTISLINAPAVNGLILVGWRVKGVGVDTTIASFGTGTGGTGTYNLSTSPGTLTSRLVAVSPMFDNTAAYNIQANPNSFATGINFGSNSITGTDGVNGVPSPAIQFGRNHGMFWFSSATIGTASIYSDATATIGSPQVQLGQTAVNFSETSSGGRNFQVQVAPNAVNYPFVAGGTTGNAATIGAVGGDTNVDLGIFCAGTGTLKFVNASHFTANGAVAMSLGSTGPTGASGTPSKWLVIKDSTGAKFAVAAYSIP